MGAISICSKLELMYVWGRNTEVEEVIYKSIKNN